jgi:hypothetical protein
MSSRVFNTKVRGEWAELAFMHEATRRGFFVARPSGDSLPYDVILDASRFDDHMRVRGRPRLWRVQIKSVATRRGNGYHILVGSNQRRYTARDFDFFVCYIVPLDLWYIIPSRICTRYLNVSLYPHSCRSRLGRPHFPRYEDFRERWDLFRPATAETIKTFN